jgi:hypothetical protein
MKKEKSKDLKSEKFAAKSTEVQTSESEEEEEEDENPMPKPPPIK